MEETRVEENIALGENEFKLPIGYTDGSGTLHRIIKLKKMTGETEEAIADAKVRNNVSKLQTELIYSVTEKLGTLPHISKDIIRSLTIPDRDFIIVMNHVVSMGNIVHFKDTCKNCGKPNEISVDLTTLPISCLKDEDTLDMTFDLVDGVKDGDGIAKSITVTVPNGFVQERVAPLVNANPALASTTVFQMITKKLGNLKYIDLDLFRKMTKADRDIINNKMAERKLGIKLQVQAVCSECGEEFDSFIPLQALLGE